MKLPPEYELGTLPGFWQDYNQRHAAGFTAATAAEAEAWQSALREHVSRCLGRMPAEVVDPTPTLIESVVEDGFTRELLVLQVQPREWMPVYVLTPTRAAAPYKPVIALHGHGTWGADQLVGIAATPAEAEFLRIHNYDYARQIVRLGYQVFVPVVRGFGERMEAAELAQQQADPTIPWLSSCQRLSYNALLTGQTLMGLRLWDTQRLIDYVQSRADVQPGRLACLGLSGGGTLTLYTAAFDARVTCAYMSGSVNTFKDSLLSIEHCLCNVVPGVAEHAEMAEIAGLIAPRPLLIEGGTDDPIYPARGLQSAAETLRRIYAAFGVPERFAAHSFEGEHRWDGAPIAAWLSAAL